MEKLTNQEVLDAGLADWRKLAQALHARFLTGDFARGLAFVTAVAEVAEEAGHHPDVTLTYPLRRHQAGQPRRLLGHRPRPRPRPADQRDRPRAGTSPPSRARLTEVELALDTADLAAVGPFWAALLTGSTDAFQGDDVVDPGGRVPLLWFQSTDAHETPRQRFHIDLWVPHDVADERIAAAVAAGGRVVDDSPAPAFAVLADPEGNRVCVCTILDR